MTNWKTSLAGLVAAVLPWLKGVLPAELGVVADAAASLALAVLGLYAADKISKKA